MGVGGRERTAEMEAISYHVHKRNPLLVVHYGNTVLKSSLTMCCRAYTCYIKHQSSFSPSDELMFLISWRE